MRHRKVARSAWLVIALLACEVALVGAKLPHDTNPDLAPHAQVELMADRPIRAILTDAHGHSDSLPGGSHHIAYWSSADFGHEPSGPTYGPRHYYCIYDLWPIPKGTFTVSAFSDSGPQDVTLIAQTRGAWVDCFAFDSLTALATRPARWSIKWHPYRPSDTCWIQLRRR